MSEGSEVGPKAAYVLRWKWHAWRLDPWVWRVYLMRSFLDRQVNGLAVCLGPVTFGIRRVKVPVTPSAPDEVTR